MVTFLLCSASRIKAEVSRTIPDSVELHLTSHELSWTNPHLVRLRNMCWIDASVHVEISLNL
ncbi:hypothetical protein BS78_K342800 [Paspalum vaginatum]|uniref:Uncharacterized protein n=1 Tax=Paspalum vaginatum TaxID=158149 RepID=A0A9W7XAV7_9POAL|nr:hypothetical protein BS78_K342800 [Paspalum vaginatum]